MSQIEGYIDQYESNQYSDLQKVVYYIQDGQTLQVDSSLQQIKSKNVAFVFTSSDSGQMEKLVYDQKQTLPSFLSTITFENVKLTGQGIYSFNSASTSFINTIYISDSYITSEQSTIYFYNLNSIVIRNLTIFYDPPSRFLQAGQASGSNSQSNDLALLIFSNCSSIYIDGLFIKGQTTHQPLISIDGQGQSSVSMNNVKIQSSQLLNQDQPVIYILNCVNENVTNINLNSIQIYQQFINSQTGHNYYQNNFTVQALTGTNPNLLGSLLNINGTQNVQIQNMVAKQINQYSLIQIDSQENDANEIFNVNTVLQNIEFEQVNVSLTDYLIYLYTKNSIQIVGLTLKNIQTNYTQVLLDCSQIQITNSVFENNISTMQTTITIQNTHIKTTSFSIQGNTFYQNKAYFGSVLNLNNLVNLLISGNTVTENTSNNFAYGPIVISSCVEVILSANKIFSNRSIMGSGGGVAIVDSQVTVNADNQIYKNTAKIGGGIRYTGSKTIFSIGKDYSSTVFQNSAELYGQNIGSYPYTFKAINGFSAFQEIASGQKISNPFQFYVLDEELNQMNIYSSTDRSGYDSSIIDEQNNFVQFDIIYDTTKYIFTDKVSYNTSSVFSYQPTVTYLPKETILLKISTSYEILIYNKKQMQFVSQFISFTINVVFRDCIQGEVLQKIQGSQITCSPCISGSYSLTDFKKQFGNNIDYSKLIDSPDNPSCLKCSDSAFKCEQNMIYAKDGFWNQQNSSVIIPCTNAPQNCVFQTYITQNQAYNTSLPYDHQICFQGMIGPLCQSCDFKGDVWGEPYGGVQPYECIKCANVQNKMSYFVLISIGFILYLAFSISSISNSIYEKKVWRALRVMHFLPVGITAENDIPYTANKQLMTHFSIIGLIGYYQFNIQLGFSVINKAADPSQSAFYSFDCLVTNVNIPIYIFKSLIGLFFFFISVFIIGILLHVLHKFRIFVQDNSKLLTFVGLFFFFGPILLKVLSAGFACQQIDDKYYIKAYMSEQCYTSTHYKALYLIIPLLCLISIIIPVFIYSRMRKHRHHLKSLVYMRRYAFLCLDFTSSHYYWELVRYTERNLISIIAIYIDDGQGSKQVVISFILISYLFLFLKTQPYNRPILNQTEIICTGVQLFNCYALSVQNNMSTAISTVLGIIYIIVNYLIIVYLLKFLIFIKIPINKEQQNHFHKFIIKLKNKFPNALSFIHTREIVNIPMFIRWKTVQKKFLMILQTRKQNLHNKMENIADSVKRKTLLKKNTEETNSPQLLLKQQSDIFTKSEDNNLILDLQNQKQGSAHQKSIFGDETPQQYYQQPQGEGNRFVLENLLDKQLMNRNNMFVQTPSSNSQNKKMSIIQFSENDIEDTEENIDENDLSIDKESKTGHINELDDEKKDVQEDKLASISSVQQQPRLSLH